MAGLEYLSPHVTLDVPHGRVNFKSAELMDGGKFLMRADDWFIVDSSARGRDNTRIRPQNAYDKSYANRARLRAHADGL
ncbi:hypothetical protein BJY52DRAFT_1378748 [Lactarius psammicola]|nr:hypothetical protein BJY52DRAFT_1378748 [Lactarius psammicola]